MTDETTDQSDEVESPRAEDTPEEWVPPTHDEWDRMQKALGKANAEAKERREKLRQLQSSTEDANTKAAREQAEAAEKRYKPVAVRAAAKAAFLEAGCNPERVARLVKLLNLDDITVDDEGDVAGLDDQVTAIKSDMPEMFAPTEKKPPRLDASNRQAVNGRVRTTGERIAAQVLG